MSDLPKVSHYGTIKIGDLAFDGVVLEGERVDIARVDSSDGFGFVFRNFNSMHAAFKTGRDRFFNLLGAARAMSGRDALEVEGLCYVPICTLAPLLELLMQPQNDDCIDVSLAVMRAAKATLVRQFILLQKTCSDEFAPIQPCLFDAGKHHGKSRQKPRRNRSSYVYFVEAEGMIKIGVTENVRSRVSSLQTGCPSKITLIKTISGGRATEERIHKRFEHLRVRGEWFEKSGELDSYICSLAEGDQQQRV